MKCVVTCVVCVLVSSASADPPTQLRIQREPPSLRMRARTAAVTPPEPAKPTAITVHREASPPEPTVLGTVRDLDRPVSIRFNLGYVVDGTSASGQPTVNEVGRDPYELARLRAYALGEGYLSTRGVIFPSLSTYFATRFQVAEPSTSLNGRLDLAPPVATWFERSGIEPRAVWGEMKDFLSDKRLAPLRVRIGQLYVYGPWVLHMYGLLAAYDGKLISASAYGGSRVPDYTREARQAKDRAGIGGASVRVDLRALRRPIPFAISGEVLAFTEAGADDQRATGHGMLQID